MTKLLLTNNKHGGTTQRPPEPVSRPSNRLGQRLHFPGVADLGATETGRLNLQNRGGKRHRPRTGGGKTQRQPEPVSQPSNASGERLHFPGVAARFGRHRNRAAKPPKPGGIAASTAARWRIATFNRPWKIAILNRPKSQSCDF